MLVKLSACMWCVYVCVRVFLTCLEMILFLVVFVRVSQSEQAKFLNDNAALEKQIAAQETILKQLRELMGAKASLTQAEERFKTAKSDLGVVTPPVRFLKNSSNGCMHWGITLHNPEGGGEGK